MSPDSITVRTNIWRIPSAERAFQGWLEGCPTPEERLQVIAKAVAARAAWKPSVEAMELVETLKIFIGYRVQIQFWDSIMWVLDEEGPYPMQCDCRGVITLMDGNFLQAFIEVGNVLEVPTPEGYSPFSYLRKHPESVFDLAPLSDLYQISKI